MRNVVCFKKKEGEIRTIVTRLSKICETLKPLSSYCEQAKNKDDFQGTNKKWLFSCWSRTQNDVPTADSKASQTFIGWKFLGKIQRFILRKRHWKHIFLLGFWVESRWAISKVDFCFSLKKYEHFCAFLKLVLEPQRKNKF